MCSHSFLINWSEHTEYLKLSLYDMYRNKVLVDCALECNGVTIYAHAFLLAAFSPVFKQSIDNGILHIKIEDVDLEILELLLEFVYLGSLVIEPQLVDSLLAAGRKYNVFGLNKMDKNDLNKSEAKSVFIKNEEEFKSLIRSQLSVGDAERELSRRRCLLAEKTQMAINRAAQESRKMIENLRRYTVFENVKPNVNEDAIAAALLEERNNFGQQEFAQQQDQSLVLVDEVGNVLGVANADASYFVTPENNNPFLVNKQEPSVEDAQSFTTEDASEGEPELDLDSPNPIRRDFSLPSLIDDDIRG